MAVKEDEVTVHKGEIVQVLTTTPHGMFLIHRPANHNSPAAEGWLPAHVIGPKDIDGSLKKTWQMFKLKKPNFRGRDEGANSPEHRSKSLGRDIKPRKIAGDPGFEVPPIVQQPLTSIIVQAGDTVTFTCKICGRPRPTISWRYQDSNPITPGPHAMLLYNEEGVATLQLSQVSLADCGEYSCVASSDLGTVVTRATLTVLDRPVHPGQPTVRNQVGTAVHLEWSPPPQTPTGQIQGYTIEFREAGSDQWHLAIPYVPNTSQVIGDLEPGVTYQFRVSANNAIGISEPSSPSTYVVVPSEFELSEREDAPCVMWKTTYENDFTDAGEIGKGRFGIVRRCVQKCSGQELAAKLIARRMVRREAVEIEFNTLQSLQHPHLAQVYDLYETSNAHIIIMQLIPHGRLFEYICGRQHFDELLAAEYIRQVLDVMQYLHNCRIAHLDVKPENLVVEVGTGVVAVKLVDFGDARHIYNNYYIHPMVGNPEFMSPEVISGTPVGLLTDVWSLGIVTYVVLSGVSPFLDESQEETCSNIVRNDFCFPDEYFAGISSDAKDLVRSMLVEDLHKRPTAQQCTDSAWIKKACAPRSSALRPKPIATARLADFVERRKHQSDTYLLKVLP
ncbi:kalirin-like [Littorina saxatilis]